MAQKKLKIGDDVRLKSGGPQMTVVGHTKSGEAECCWFDDDRKERRTHFPESALLVTPMAELSDAQLRARVENELLQQGSMARHPKRAK